MSKAAVKHHKYDVALSFAGEQRVYAKELARLLRAAGVRVFYDEDEKANLWGRNLVDYLYEIYCNEARFCVVFVSRAYATKRWTTHERKAAQVRVLREVTSEYLLPIKVDDTLLPGLPESVGYVSIKDGIKAIAKELLKKLRGRLVENFVSEAALKGYASRFVHFEAWCADNRLPSLPTTPDVVGRYLKALADGKVRVRWHARNGALKTRTTPKSYGSIEQDYMAIIRAQRAAGHEWPHAQPDVVRVKKDIRRRLGTNTDRAAPLMIADLKRCLVQYWNGSELATARNKAILALGFFSAMRRAELVALRVEDLSFAREGGRLLVTLRKSKARVAVPPHKDAAVCPVRLVKAWLKKSELKSGPLFRRIDPRTDSIGPNALSGHTITILVKEVVERAGLDPEHYSAHSLRTGFAASAAAAGKSLHSIMRQTRHKSARVAATYTGRPKAGRNREAYLFDDNAAEGID